MSASGADVVVLGGGIVGCAIARELARRGADVVVVERGEPAAEATRAAAGMVAPQAETDAAGPVLRLGVASRDRYPAWVTAIEAESGIDVAFRTDGILYVARWPGDARVLAARARWQRAAGLRVRQVSAAAARRRVPALPRDLPLALHFPDDHRVDNERLGAAVARAAERAGVRLRTHTAVRAIRARRGTVVGIDTDRGRLEARAVVNAAGAWAARIALPRGSAAPPVFPVRGQMLVLHAPGALPLPLYSRRVYLVPRLDGRILVGATREPAELDKRVTLAGAATLLAAAHALVPGLGAAALVGHWAGLRPGTPDGRPILGPAPDLAGLWLATGHYRHGILLAPATAEAIADLVTGGRTALPIVGMAPRRFARG
ncbi:MAG: glycine oxidase ThiO [bacterium]|nr:glycine oxidase ThiO [bacterium]